jgi:hypothetical protein
MKIMLILTFYAIVGRGEGLGLKRNRERRGYIQYSVLLRNYVLIDWRVK